MPIKEEWIKSSVQDFMILFGVVPNLIERQIGAGFILQWRWWNFGDDGGTQFKFNSDAVTLVISTGEQHITVLSNIHFLELDTKSGKTQSFYFFLILCYFWAKKAFFANLKHFTLILKMFYPYLGFYAIFVLTYSRQIISMSETTSSFNYLTRPSFCITLPLLKYLIAIS